MAAAVLGSWVLCVLRVVDPAAVKASLSLKRDRCPLVRMCAGALLQGQRPRLGIARAPRSLPAGACTPPRARAPHESWALLPPPSMPAVLSPPPTAPVHLLRPASVGACLRSRLVFFLSCLHLSFVSAPVFLRVSQGSALHARHALALRKVEGGRRALQLAERALLTGCNLE